MASAVPDSQQVTEERGEDQDIVSSLASAVAKLRAENLRLRSENERQRDEAVALKSRIAELEAGLREKEDSGKTQDEDSTTAEEQSHSEEDEDHTHGESSEEAGDVGETGHKARKLKIQDLLGVAMPTVPAGVSQGPKKSVLRQALALRRAVSGKMRTKQPNARIQQPIARNLMSKGKR